MKYLFIFQFLFTVGFLNAATVPQTLYINRDTVTMGGKLVNRCVFNVSATFSPKNAIIDLSEGDLLELTLINNDTIPHIFGLLTGSTFGTINAGESQVHSISFTEFGTFGLMLKDNRGRMLGAIVPVRVGISSTAKFLWNFWEMNDTTSLKIGDGIYDTIVEEYRPNVNVVNAEVYPQTATDPIGAVVGNVNDELYISMVNAGNMTHTLHFHGYHVEILQAIQNSHMVSWIKDGIPLHPNEAVTVRLIPDKPGMYPVHDHNLISVLTGNIYPGGMINVLHIMP